jgi:hypothetical protein
VILDHPTSSHPIEQLAPTCDLATDYDRRHLSVYAALLDSADAGEGWQHAAAKILGVDVNSPDAEACWRSHLERARWIVGEGLASAVAAFGVAPDRAA